MGTSTYVHALVPDAIEKCLCGCALFVLDFIVAINAVMTTCSYNLTVHAATTTNHDDGKNYYDYYEYGLISIQMKLTVTSWAWAELRLNRLSKELTYYHSWSNQITAS